MTRVSAPRTSTPGVFALGLSFALASCAESVAPGDPLLGTWRSDPFDAEYPSPPSVAHTVEELTFNADGSAAVVVTRAYGDVAGDPLRGCTWVERHPSWVWLRQPDAGAEIAFAPRLDTRLTSERTGCADPSQNRAPHMLDETSLLIGAVVASYTIEGDRMQLTFIGPVNQPTVTLGYTRVRR